jgi:hypothetical protein
MKQVKLFAVIDDYEVALMFTWDDGEKSWVCKMEDDFMKELGPIPVEKNT